MGSILPAFLQGGGVGRGRGLITVVTTNPATVAATTNNSGNQPWENIANAEGNPDGAEAEITVNSSITTQSANADLKLSGFGSVGTGTRQKVEVLLTHRWDLTVGATATASTVVTLRDGAGVLLATLINRSENSGDQATLLEETFDVTADVAGLSEAQLADVQVWCEFDAALPLTTGNASWMVDAVQLRGTYEN